MITVTGPAGWPTRPLHVHPGDQLTVRLVQNGSTGYLWSASFVPAVLTGTGDVAIPPAPGMPPGSPGEHGFSYQVSAAGGGVLRLSLQRPWEPAPIQTLTLELVSRPG